MLLENLNKRNNYLNIYTKEQGITLMNKWGAQKRPFLFLSDFEGDNNLMIPLDQIDQQEFLFSFSGKGNSVTQKTTPSGSVYFKKQLISIEQYAKAFELVQAEIHQGNSYLLNLTFPTPIETNLDLKSIFLHSEARYRLWWKEHFTVFSPEPFVEIKYGRISSYPMKGTIMADQAQALDQLLANPKEQAEHATIVDLIRNDLSRVAKQVRVERYRYAQSVKSTNGLIFQTSSKISGLLPDNYQNVLGDIFFSLLPAGSISGAPKKKTIEIIKAAENYDRGFYTGVCGIFDGQHLDSGVMIRFIEKTKSGLVFKSGGGITSQSRMTEEYEELSQKVYLPFQVPTKVEA